MPHILSLLQQLQPILSKTTCKQLYVIVMSVLVMPANITQRNIARWADQGGSYRTIQRFFHTNIDWLQVKWLFFLLFIYLSGTTYLLVGDETVLKKSGKHTFGLDYFFSSLADKPVPGIAFFVFALVNVTTEDAYTLCAEQVIKTKEEKEKAHLQKLKRKSKQKSQMARMGRPLGSKNKNKEEITLCPELERIFLWAQKVMMVIGKKIPVQYFALDGHFGNHPAYQMTRKLGLHLISKMRHNVALYLIPSEEQKQKQPRLKYGAKIDYDDLPITSRISCEREGNFQTEIYQISCRHKDFADVLNIVIIVKTNLLTKKRSHVVLLSSDLSLDALTLIKYYSLRFQIEFEFRDAKQHFGLSDFCCVSEVAIRNSVGLAFFMGNLSLYLLGALREQFPEAGIFDLKSYYRGRRYALETLKCLPDLADDIVCSDILDRVCRLGLIHAPFKEERHSPSLSQRGLSL
jgi:putative transposase